MFQTTNQPTMKHIKPTSFIGSETLGAIPVGDVAQVAPGTWTEINSARHAWNLGHAVNKWKYEYLKIYIYIYTYIYIYILLLS